MITYLVTGTIDDSQIQCLTHQLAIDKRNGDKVSQIFFYTDAVMIGGLSNYSLQLELFIDIADDNNIVLSICSAGFQARKFHVSDLAKQDFNFKGLGQFVADCKEADTTRLFPQIAARGKQAFVLPSQRNHFNYDLLISIDETCCHNNIKEYLEVALVNAAYDVSVVVFISSDLARHLQTKENTEIKHTINMMAEFNIPLYSDYAETMLFEIVLKKAEYQQLELTSLHHYSFQN